MLLIYCKIYQRQSFVYYESMVVTFTYIGYFKYLLLNNK